MDGLFESGNNTNNLFQERKQKKDVKKIFKTIFVILLILVIIAGSCYGVFYYLTEIKNRDAKTDIIEIARNIDLNMYTDLKGLSEYFDNINKNSYEFNTEFELNNHDLNNLIKDSLKNEDVNIKEFKLNFNGKVDRNNNKLQTYVDLKHKGNSVFDFQIQDTGKNILFHGKDLFYEYIGIEKTKLKSFVVKEYKVDNKMATSLENLTQISLDTNYIKEVNVILNSILSSMPEALNELSDESFELNRNVKVNYRNNSLNAQTYILKLNAQQYINLYKRIENLSKIKANDASIELSSLVGRTDNMVEFVLKYLNQIINLKSDETLHINMYNFKDSIAKIDFVKVNQNLEEKIVFEIELISEKNTNEILISNDELKFKISITKDNNKIYTKIDIDGKIPIPEAFNLDGEDNLVKEVNNTEETILDGERDNLINIIGETKKFATNAIIPDNPLQVNDSNTNNNNTIDNNILKIPSEENKEDIPKVDFVEDLDAVLLNESVFTKNWN